MIIKPGVRIAGLSINMQLALDWAEEVYEKYGHSLIITEGYAFSGHMKNSKHYTGEAVDIRIWNLGADTHRIYGQIKKGLDDYGYDTILESDHIHIEYDPKGGIPCQHG
jgi:hypothetical protein